MPNHVTNILNVTGPTEDVERFRVAVSFENPALQEHYKKRCLAEAESNKKDMEKYPEGTPGYKYAKSQYERNLEDSKKPYDAILDFNGTVPLPEELMGSVSGSPSTIPDWQKEKSAELIKKYGADNWYTYNINNWGTKWNAYDVSDIKKINDGLQYKFDTAWSPPSAWLEKTSQQYPTLEFENNYLSEGGECGRITASINGTYHKENNAVDWKLSYDESFKEQYEMIKEGPYEEVMQRYQNEEEIDDSDFSEILLDRIKNEDLPLFMNFDWWKNEVKEKYKERVRNANKHR